jgi:hypothetical protein
MHGIYIAALLTTLLSVVIYGALIHRLSPLNERRLLMLAAMVTLPLQPLAYYLVRVPLDQWLVAHFTQTSLSYQWLTSLYAPLTEEPAKLLALFIPSIMRDIRPESIGRYALAIGLGFAVGEMWFVAERISHQPSLALLPFHQFGGYAVERMMTCVFHSAFVVIALAQFRRRFLTGFIGAVTAHWAANFPILLMAWNTGNLGREAWGLLVGVWLAMLFMVALGLLAYFIFGRPSPMSLIFGRRLCPECGGEYDAPLLAINCGLTRYERCPHCQRWHWTKSIKV